MTADLFRFGLGMAALALGLAAVPPYAGATVLEPGDFLAGQVRAFHGKTRYEAARIDGLPAIQASCDNAASGLIVKRRIDLRETPILEWSWGVASVFAPERDERSKAGDDYPVRLNIISDAGSWPMRSRAVTYVWASGEPVGADWPNAYVPQSRMVAVRSGPPDPAMPWTTQRRDLRADFQRYFGRDVDFVDAVAIMTDCDDRAARIEARYGQVRFLPQGNNS